MSKISRVEMITILVFLGAALVRIGYHGYHKQWQEVLFFMIAVGVISIVFMKMYTSLAANRRRHEKEQLKGAASSQMRQGD